MKGGLFFNTSTDQRKYMELANDLWHENEKSWVWDSHTFHPTSASLKNEFDNESDKRQSFTSLIEIRTFAII